MSIWHVAMIHQYLSFNCMNIPRLCPVLKFNFSLRLLK